MSNKTKTIQPPPGVVNLGCPTCGRVVNYDLAFLLRNPGGVCLHDGQSGLGNLTGGTRWLPLKSAELDLSWAGDVDPGGPQ